MKLVTYLYENTSIYRIDEQSDQIKRSTTGLAAARQLSILELIEIIIYLPYEDTFVV